MKRFVAMILLVGALFSFLPMVPGYLEVPPGPPPQDPPPRPARLI